MFKFDEAIAALERQNERLRADNARLAAEADRLRKQRDEAVALLQRAKGRLGAWFGLHDDIDALLRAVGEEDKPC